MQKSNLIEQIMIKDLSDKEILELLEKGNIDIYQREGNRIWANNYYHPGDAEYYLLGEYHSFDITELENYEEKENIFDFLKLYIYENSEEEILNIIKTQIKDEVYIYKVSNFIDGLEHFIESNNEYGIYAV